MDGELTCQIHGFHEELCFEHDAQLLPSLFISILHVHPAYSSVRSLLLWTKHGRKETKELVFKNNSKWDEPKLRTTCKSCKKKIWPAWLMPADNLPCSFVNLVVMPMHFFSATSVHCAENVFAYLKIGVRLHSFAPYGFNPNRTQQGVGQIEPSVGFTSEYACKGLHNTTITIVSARLLLRTEREKKPSLETISRMGTWLTIIWISLTWQDLYVKTSSKWAQL